MRQGTRGRYTLEFKQEAVRLVESGQTMAAVRNLPAPRQMLVVTGDADAEHPALHPDRPDPLVALNKGILTSGPLRRMPSLFPGCRAPSLPAPTRPEGG